MISSRPSLGSASALSLVFAAVCFGVFAPAARAQTVFMYVSQRNAATVNQITDTGVVSVFSSSNLFNIEGLAFDSSGNLYVGNSFNTSSDSVTKIAPNGVGTIFASFGTQVSPGRIAFDSGGNLYVASQVSVGIRKITPGGVISIFSSGGPDEGHFGLAFDGFGNLYTTGSEKIVKYTPDGTASVFVNFAPGNGPQDVSFDNAGNMFVALQTSHSIAKITAGGAVTTFFSGAVLAGIQGIGVDSTGAVFGVVGQNIVRVAADGGSAVVFATINAFDASNQFLAFAPGFGASPVPEPSTYAALLGLAALGVVWQRRRKSVSK